ncbi:MAG: toll/interleukin-1 receptor domain-containing protein [Elusimicrobia bacterium]|nr:toll/interleukin-1 receptor domain-containing protein [Elusimicrobiota bacterium]
MVKNKRDVFICHASENKDKIVRPLVKEFDRLGISYWFDEAEISWGDSLTKKVNEGLRMSKYVLVILSSYFVSKKWPEKELYSALNIELSSDNIKVLPLIVGTEKEKELILENYPLINDKKYLPWNNNISDIVNALMKKLNTANTKKQINKFTDESIESDIPIPKIKKKFTDRDRNIFLKEAFNEIRKYFEKALKKIQNHYSKVESELIDIHNLKFIVKIYSNGELKNQCKIWIGGLDSSYSIGYKEGDCNIDDDNSYNDILYVKDNEYEMGFDPLSKNLSNSKYRDVEILDLKLTCEYLWESFSESLEY